MAKSAPGTSASVSQGSASAVVPSFRNASSAATHDPDANDVNAESFGAESRMPLSSERVPSVDDAAPGAGAGGAAGDGPGS